MTYILCIYYIYVYMACMLHEKISLISCINGYFYLLNFIFTYALCMHECLCVSMLLWHGHSCAQEVRREHLISWAAYTDICELLDVGEGREFQFWPFFFSRAASNLCQSYILILKWWPFPFPILLSYANVFYNLLLKWPRPKLRVLYVFSPQLQNLP